jgi:hypothetical protein
MSRQSEFFDTHTRSFIFLCMTAAGLGYGLCNYIGWNEPGQAFVFILLTELLLVSLGVLAMLFAEKWFVELDATAVDWTPLPNRGEAKTFFNGGKRRARPKFDHAGDFLRMVAQEMQPGADGSYFGNADPFANTRPGKKSPFPAATAPAPRQVISLADALQIQKPTVRSALSNYVPPPLPVAPQPVAPPPSPAPYAAPVYAAPVPPPIPYSYQQAPVAPVMAPHAALQAAPSAASSSYVAPSLAAAMAPSSSRPATPPAQGPIVALGTPPGNGGMRPKPPRHRSA